METRDFLIKISFDGTVEFYNEQGDPLTEEEIAAIKQMIETKEIIEDIRNDENVINNSELKRDIHILALNYYEAMKEFVATNRSILVKLATARMKQNEEEYEEYDDEEYIDSFEF